MGHEERLSREEHFTHLIESFEAVVNAEHSNPDWAQAGATIGVGLASIAVAGALHDVADAIREGNTPPTAEEAEVAEYADNVLRYNKGGFVA